MEKYVNLVCVLTELSNKKRTGMITVGHGAITKGWKKHKVMPNK